MPGPSQQPLRSLPGEECTELEEGTSVQADGGFERKVQEVQEESEAQRSSRDPGEEQGSDQCSVS